jgi:hypothetical protein
MALPSSGDAGPDVQPHSVGRLPRAIRSPSWAAGKTRNMLKSATLTHLANKLPAESLDGPMPSNRYTDNIPDPVKDQKPVDDFFASKLAERIRIDNWRTQLTLIRGEYSKSPSKAHSKV